jgi:hypothetical protein
MGFSSACLQLQQGTHSLGFPPLTMAHGPIVTAPGCASSRGT